MDTPPIHIPVGSTRFCWICGKPVSLETCMVDQHGKAVHEQCYVVKVKADGEASRKRSEAKAPEGRWWP